MALLYAEKKGVQGQHLEIFSEVMRAQRHTRMPRTTICAHHLETCSNAVVYTTGAETVARAAEPALPSVG